MIKLSNFDLSIDDQVVLDKIDINFGHQTYLLSGHMHKRKSAFLNALAQAYSAYNPSISYALETGIVYLPATRILFEHLSVKQNIDFFAKFFNTPSIKIRMIIDHFELEPYLSRKVNSLTGDIKQLVRVVCSFLNTTASVYLLDNPFELLNKSEIDLVKNYLKLIENKIILIISKLNTHEIEEFKPRVINILDKKFVYEGE